MAGRLDGRVAIVTGVASGIGAASARLFAAEGARVVLADRNTSLLENVNNEISDSGGSAIAVETDVTDEASIQRMVQQESKPLVPCTCSTPMPASADGSIWRQSL